jgi:hypothetical protein
MASEKQNFTFYQGEDEQVDFYVTDEGAPKNLTGATVEWGLWSSSARLLTKGTGSGATLVNGSGVNDVVRITIAKVDSLSLPAGAYYHECRVALSGNEQVVAVGQALLRESKTKD